ncbi:MAG: diguanylate cyclase/phosphodiesterase (GGDEF & EAL domains) with PAS/PAC sensor(s) [Pseudolabrys sp.]|jgi:diguanylate cyclase (GGDEF)-like protein/PAS domain S-box-containing protein|nr:diguanylate cyclase/phosphodiesterase (GGDEF & EAL domains) with PAS/PAC sensor(s) [Pseudolabrys sp.]
MLEILNWIGDQAPQLVAYELAALTTILAATIYLASILVRVVLNRVREQNRLLDAATNNMVQGLCMFDADNRLLVWNQRYVEMYSIDPKRIWRGCSLKDLLEARVATGTFPLDIDAYQADMAKKLNRGERFTITVQLPDGRVIAGVNQPMAGGGWVATHEDITERTRAERELKQAEAFLDAVIHHVPTPIVVKSVSDFRYRLINRAAEKFFGSNDRMVGKSAAEVFAPELAERIMMRDLEVLEAGHEVLFGEHLVPTTAGDNRVVSELRLPVPGADGAPQYIISVLDDVTQRKRDAARITYMAHHDSMTDLPNRIAFNECLESTLKIAAGNGESFAVLCMDVDRFKAINDTFGPVTGDELLRQMADRLADASQGAFIARTGGDEFAAVTPTGPQPDGAEALAERLRDTLVADFEIEGHRISASITIGVAIFPLDAADTTGLLANAEAALYRAKLESRGSIRFFKPDMDKQLREKRALQHDLRQALANDELELYYQPQSTMDGTIIGFEALVRWHHPRQGMVPPSTFIPLAEESGLIIPLGEWILRTACREAASWPKPLSIAVNLSPVQFQHGELVNVVHAALLETGLSPQRLELEITEGVLIGDFSRAMSILRRLKNMGVHIAMDDFGTGYSSLSYLQSFPLDKIKIDQVFIANLLNNPQSAAIVRAVIGLGRGLQLPVVAEGVETEEQRAFLARASCDGVQGYLIGRPQPIAFYAELVGRPSDKKRRLSIAS